MADLRMAYKALDPARFADETVYVTRPGDPVGIVREEFRIRPSSLRILLGGQRGVGKTTELHRLRALISLRTLFSQPRFGCMLLDVAGLSVQEAMQKIVLFIASENGIMVTEEKMNRRWNSATFNQELVESFFNQDSQPPILLIDGLEKVAPSEAEAFLVAFRAVGAHMVLVAPIPLLLAPEFSSTVSEWDRVLFLPAIPVHTRAGEPAPAGVDHMRSVINRRVGGGIFDEDALRFLISASAGLHRELISLSQQACMRAAVAGRPSVSIDIAQSTVNDKRHEYSFHLTPQDIEYLRDVVAQHQRITGDPRALSLISRNLIVSYQDDSAWFDVHPIIKPLLLQRSGKTGPT